MKVPTGMLQGRGPSTFLRLLKTTWFIPLILGLSYVLLNLPNIEFASLYLDEAYSIYHCQDSLAEIQRIMEREANPPLYYLLLFGWIKTFGISVTATCLLSLVLMSGAISWTFVYARRYFGWLAAILAGGVLFFSNLHLHYGMEVRSFALVCLLAIWSLWCFTRLVHENKRWAWGGLAVANTALLYTHYASFFLPVMELFAYLAFLSGWRKTGIKIGLAYTVTALAFLPQLLSITSQKIDSTNQWLGSPSFADLQQFVLDFTGGESIQIGRYIVVISFLVMLALWYWYRPSLKIKGYGRAAGLPILLLLCSIGTVLLAWVVSQKVALFLPKYLLYASVPGALLIGYVVQFAPYRFRLFNYGTVLLVLVSMIISFRPEQAKSEDWKGALSLAQEFRQYEESALLVSPVYQRRVVAYYALPEAFVAGEDSIIPKLYQAGIICFDRLDAPFFDYHPYEEFVLLQSHQAYIDPDGVNEMQLRQAGYQKITTEKVAGIEISRWLMREE